MHTSTTRRIDIREMGPDPIDGVDIYAVYNPASEDVISTFTAFQYKEQVDMIRELGRLFEFSVIEDGSL